MTAVYHSRVVYGGLSDGVDLILDMRHSNSSAVTINDIPDIVLVKEVTERCHTAHNL